MRRRRTVEDASAQLGAAKRIGQQPGVCNRAWSNHRMLRELSDYSKLS
jgi:hypothetical protein